MLSVSEIKQKFFDNASVKNQNITLKDYMQIDGQKGAVNIKELTAQRADSIIAIASGKTFLYRFYYNNTGSLTSYIMYEKNGGLWINSQRVRYTYASVGKSDAEVTEIWKNNAWVVSSRLSYTYDANGHCSMERYEETDSSGFVPIYQYITNYNERGLLVWDMYQEWIGSEWKNISKQNNEYYENNLLKTMANSTWVNNAWKDFNKQSYSYTSWGEYSEVILYIYAETVMAAKANFEYNNDRLITLLYASEYDGANWNVYMRTEHSYSDNNKVHVEINKRGGNGIFSNITQECDTLDQSGRIIIHYSYNWADSVWVPYSREYTSYNSVDNIVTFSSDEFAGNAWTLKQKSEYGYDQTGALLQSFSYSAWDNGTPVDNSFTLHLNIDYNSLRSLDVSGKDIKIWYKSVTIPVELASFTAMCLKDKAVLNWSTATETNNRGFEIERKSSSSDWEKIGFVSGNGTTAKEHSYAFEDVDLPAGNLRYRLKQIDMDGAYTYSKETELNSGAINAFTLEQNYPNPFNPSTTIGYSVPAASKVNLKVYDMLGREVAVLVNETMPAGGYEVKFNASGLSSGVYFYKLRAGNFTITKKLNLIK
jgi:hypothetical protein